MTDIDVANADLLLTTTKQVRKRLAHVVVIIDNRHHWRFGQAYDPH